MINNKEEFSRRYSELADSMFGIDTGRLSNRDRYAVLAELIKAEAKERAAEKKKSDKNDKKVYYFSMEFLIGKLMENYLINLGIRDFAEETLKEYGADIDDILAFEPDPGLGNGGLGRLAACFLDSMAALGINGDGMGLRYKFGLFKQKIENGYQFEEPDAWLDDG